MRLKILQLSNGLRATLPPLLSPLLPVPAAPYAGAVTVGAVNAGFYGASITKKRVAAAEQAGKLNRSKFESDVTRLNDDKKALESIPAGASSQRDSTNGCRSEPKNSAGNNARSHVGRSP